jgi:hypothetical protein
MMDVDGRSSETIPAYSTAVASTPGIEAALDAQPVLVASTDGDLDSAHVVTVRADNEIAESDSTKTFKVVFLGTGVSTAVPVMRHILTNCCNVCRHAFQIPCSYNRRNNVSICLLYDDDNEEREPNNEVGRCCVLVDAGKTMREACMRVLPAHGVSNVDAILLTHGHADAILGLDDVRYIMLKIK